MQTKKTNALPWKKCWKLIVESHGAKYFKKQHENSYKISELFAKFELSLFLPYMNSSLMRSAHWQATGIAKSMALRLRSPYGGVNMCGRARYVSRFRCSPDLTVNVQVSSQSTVGVGFTFLHLMKASVHLAKPRLFRHLETRSSHRLSQKNLQNSEQPFI